MKIIAQRHRDGFVAYPLGMKGVVVGQGESYEAALADCRSAIRFHVARIQLASATVNKVVVP